MDKTTAKILLSKMVSTFYNDTINRFSCKHWSHMSTWFWLFVISYYKQRRFLAGSVKVNYRSSLSSPRIKANKLNIPKRYPGVNSLFAAAGFHAKCDMWFYHILDMQLRLIIVCLQLRARIINDGSRRQLRAYLRIAQNAIIEWQKVADHDQIYLDISSCSYPRLTRNWRTWCRSPLRNCKELFRYARAATKIIGFSSPGAIAHTPLLSIGETFDS